MSPYLPLISPELTSVVTVNRGGVALIGIDPKTKQATAVGPAAGKID